MPAQPVAARFAINVIENNSSELLFLRRDESLTLAPGKWGFPAGHMETGESPRQCADRERREEIGAEHVVNLVKTHGPVRDTKFGGKYEIYLFHYHWCLGDITLNHEHSEYRWLGKETYTDYEVMDGIDEDLVYLGIWQDD